MNNSLFWLSRSFPIECAHRLPSLGMPENARLHGHSYMVTLWWRGTIRADGTIVDQATVDREIGFVTDSLDHQFLNDVLELPPTMEAITAFIAASCSSVARITLTRPTVGMTCEWVRP